MRKKALTLIALIAIVPALLSGKRQSIDDWWNFYPAVSGTYHCYDFETGELIPDRFVMVYVDGEEKSIEFYDCAPGLYFSCTAKTCLKLDDEGMCSHVKDLGLKE